MPYLYHWNVPVLLHNPPTIMRMNSARQLPIGSLIDAAGVRVTTGNSRLDWVLKWGFWGGMAYAIYHLAKTAISPLPTGF